LFMTSMALPFVIQIERHLIYFGLEVQLQERYSVSV
jgi:hypothetical protein